jgi:hypothetical protein
MGNVIITSLIKYVYGLIERFIKKKAIIATSTSEDKRNKTKNHYSVIDYCHNQCMIVDLCLVRYCGSKKIPVLPVEIRLLIKQYAFEVINEKNISKIMQMYLHSRRRRHILVPKYGNICCWNFHNVKQVVLMDRWYWPINMDASHPSFEKW